MVDGVGEVVTPQVVSSSHQAASTSHPLTDHAGKSTSTSSKSSRRPQPTPACPISNYPTRATKPPPVTYWNSSQSITPLRRQRY
ncbi:hypothetical protein ATANTOWER_022545 [Ataeniobius toweri]|uniref:Uncharacterized protein n=1 Tax=Ataeniobius toweri TaxID=208326 RepID=A0ABU7AI44_9TELE|nr:hypothetical protein [Ataeniobius toweri]